jgi:transposase
MFSRLLRYMKNYSSDITDNQWIQLRGILRDYCQKTHSLRDLFNAIFYLLKTGCQWRMLPRCFPKWELVYYYFPHENINFLNERGKTGEILNIKILMKI